MKFLTYALGSSCLTGLIFYTSYLRYQQFYPTCVHLATGKFNQMVLGNFFILLLILVGRLVKTLCFGKLREREVEHVYEKMASVVFDALLLATEFSSDLNSRFLVLFSIMIAVSIFHWLVKTRVDFMELQPNLSLFTHFRIYALIATLSLIDGLNVFYAISSTYVHGPSFQILFGSEYLLLFWSLGMVETKFFFNFLERILERPIRSKVGFLRLAEFIEELFRSLTLIAFFIAMQAYYGIPIHLIRRIISSLNHLSRRYSELRDYYRLVLNLNNIFPAATREELQENPLCVICREDMTEARKLPCGHLFHGNCLCEWLSRSNECPTCRRSLVNHQPNPPPQNQPNRPLNHQLPQPPFAPAQHQPLPRVEIPRPNPPVANFNVQQNQPANVYPRNAQPQQPPQPQQAQFQTPDLAQWTEDLSVRQVHHQSPVISESNRAPNQSELDAKIDSLEQVTLLMSQLLEDIQSQLSDLRVLSEASRASAHSSPQIGLEKQEIEIKAETPSSEYTEQTLHNEPQPEEEQEESLIPVKDDDNSLDSLRKRRLSRFSDSQ